MQKIALVVGLTLLLLAGSRSVAGESATATMTVSCTVLPIAIVSIGDNGGNSIIIVVHEDQSVETASQDLKWTTNLDGMQITVQSSLPEQEQHNALYIRAVNFQRSHQTQPTGWVRVTEIESMLITGIAHESAQCQVEYTALPKEGGLGGVDLHVVTFTITGE